MRTTVALALFLAAASQASAQDVVKLRNGKHLSGTILIDESDSNGFKIVRWDTGGTVYVKWSQVSDFEKKRLLNKQDGDGVAGDTMEGVRVTTRTREMVGLLMNSAGDPIKPPAKIEQLDSTVRIKVKDSAAPVPVVRSSIEDYEVVKVRECDAFSAMEMVDRRLKVADAKDVAKLLEIAQMARDLKLYEKAKEICLQAAAADPSKKDEIDAIVAQLEGQIKEQAAENKLADIKKLGEAGKFEDAIPAAEKWLADYAETRIGQKNADLVSALKKEADEYSKNRAAFLAKKVPDAWRLARSGYLSEYAKSKYKIAEAREMTARLDDEILAKLSKQFNCPPEDIDKAWQSREKKPKTVDMGDGSWIYKGGQDGGLDYEGGGGAGDKGDDPADDFARRFGGKKGKDEKKVQDGKPLETSDQWWSRNSQSARAEWLETEYALTARYCKKDKEEEKKCSRCQGKGTIKSTRNAKSLDVLCGRCHKSGVDVSVTYW